MPAAGHGLTGPHARVAERLLELGLGPARRRRPLVEVPDTQTDVRIGDVRDAAREAGIDAALATPLARARRGDRPARRLPGARPAARARARPRSLAALAAQLAVAVQNAQLHEQTAELSSQREAALASEREAARRLGALYEISRSFAQSLSLDATLEALARTVVDVLDVDAAVIRMPDARREQLEPRAMHVKDAAARGRGAHDPLPAAAVRRERGAAAVPRGAPVPAPAPHGVRRGERAARAVPRDGLDAVPSCPSRRRQR